MPCYYPIKGFLCQARGFHMVQNSKCSYNCRDQTVSCGQCLGCRRERARQWAVRCMHESKMWSKNCFITLTYGDEHLPYDESLDYEHFQLFMKRLRKRFKGVDAGPDGEHPIRFYMAGEYGGKLGRPHFHALLFNFDFDDKRLWQKTKAGSLIYRSEKLEELWPFGYSSIGDVTYQSAGYVARYIDAKITGKIADDWYSWVHPLTGEVLWKRPEFNKMSLKPGIGATWFDKFKSDVFPHDRVVVDGKPQKVPRYYDKLYAAEDMTSYQVDRGGVFPEMVSFSPQMNAVKLDREERAFNLLDDNTPERLKAKEQVQLANSKRLIRSLQ